jgi:hypothetical protein
LLPWSAEADPTKIREYILIHLSFNVARQRNGDTSKTRIKKQENRPLASASFGGMSPIGYVPNQEKIRRI